MGGRERGGKNPPLFLFISSTLFLPFHHTRAQSYRLTGDLFFGCTPKNSCVIAPVHRKTQSTSDYTYELELERWCMFNWSFLSMDSTNSNVLFHFDVLLHPRLFCFVINTADTCKYYMLRTKHVLFAQQTIMSNVQF